MALKLLRKPCTRYRAYALLYLLVTAAEAQALDPGAPVPQYRRASWKSEDGFPLRSISAIAQDRDGYLWLSSIEFGLVRFDGVSFVRWDAQRSRGLPQGGIRTLFRARDGSIWIAFIEEHSVGRLVPTGTSEWTYEEYEDGPKELVFAIVEDREGVIWAGGPNGLSRYMDGVWNRVQFQDAQAQPVYSLYEDRAATLWLGGAEGILYLEKGSKTFRPLTQTVAADHFSEDRLGNIWASGPATPLRVVFQRGSAAVHHGIGAQTTRAFRVLHDRDGNTWVATRGDGLLRIPDQQAGIRSPATRYSVDEGLTSDRVRVLFEDRDGNLWVGTENGLDLLASTQGGLAGRGSFLPVRVRAIAVAEDGGVWLGGADGLYRAFDSTSYRHDDTRGVPSTAINALHRDRAGTVWVATEGGRIGRIVNGRFSDFDLPKRDELKRVTVITSDHEGGLWLNEYDRGIVRWHRGKFEEISRNPARLLYVDQKGRVWIAFRNGTLSAYEGGRLRDFSVGYGLVDTNASAFYEDRNGRLWVGTRGSLSEFDGHKFHSVTSIGDLSLSTIWGIVEDDDSNLWLALASGLVRVRRSDLEGTLTQAKGAKGAIRYTKYDIADGLGGIPMFGSPSSARAADGTLWFVMDNGVAVLKPLLLAKDQPESRAQIQDVVVDGNKVTPTRGIEFSPGTSRVEISYTAPTLTNSNKVSFRYLLEGLDKEWVDAGKRRQAFYANLKPGTYRFRVAGVAGGVASNPEATWTFSIRPRIYQTTWFYGCCLITLALTAWTGWRLRVRHIKHEFALVLAERVRIGREIHDTLLQGLVGMALELDELLSELEVLPHKAKRHVEQLRNQTEMYISETRQSIWGLRSPLLDRVDLPALLRETGTSIIGSRPVAFEFVVAGTPRRCTPKIEEQLRRIGQEAVSNVVRHAHATRVRMEVTYEDKAVRLGVEDDGCGFEPSESSNLTGHCGLEAMQERARDAAGRCSISAAPGRGTRVDVVIPFDE